MAINCVGSHFWRAFGGMLGGEVIRSVADRPPLARLYAASLYRRYIAGPRGRRASCPPNGRTQHAPRAFHRPSLLFELVVPRFRIGLLLTLLAASTARGQAALAQTDTSVRSSSASRSSVHQYESREELEAQVRTAEAQHRTGEAWLLKQRLKNGDFQESDRMIIVLQNNPTPADTYTVRAGRLLEIPRFGQIELAGVLRSELTDRISEQLAKYLRDPVVRATPLIRVGVLGHVGRPGYYYAPADVILSDVLMKAGGPAPDADLARVIIRRGTDVIWNSHDARTALAEGLTLDQLHLRAGDEIEVGAKRQVSTMAVISVVSAISLLIGSLLRLR